MIDSSWTSSLTTLFYLLPSLQFDPAPRAGEPLVSRRVPDVRVLSTLTLGHVSDHVPFSQLLQYFL